MVFKNSGHSVSICVLFVIQGDIAVGNKCIEDGACNDERTCAHCNVTVG